MSAKMMLGQDAGLRTDFYELTMAQAFFLSGQASVPARFDYFFRENPFNGGYALFAGLDDLLDTIEGFSFDDDAIRFLKDQGLNDRFLDYLKGFRFRGTIHSAKEGEVVFPLEPVVTVDGTIVETQLIETILLNLLNFESLIATKASRIAQAANGRRVVDFGLRRAQGLGGMQASKACAIGGFDATSNVSAAFQYGLEVTGTQAHSWIQSFGDERTAFKRFAEIFPDRCILLVDTYNTLQSGLPNAIAVGKEMRKTGHDLLGIRLDSGDLAYLSKHARAMLDEAGLSSVKIIASNQLDEYVIRSLLNQGAPIDAFGVGTRVITGQPDAALDGVYKLAEFDGKPRLKFSENFTKITLPGRKGIYRCLDGDGMFNADAIVLEGEQEVDWIYHPLFPENRSSVKSIRSLKVLEKVMDSGRRMFAWEVVDSKRIATDRLAHLVVEHKRFENPHVYKVGISKRLLDLRSSLVDEIHAGMTGKELS